jgi:thioredoxin 1
MKSTTHQIPQVDEKTFEAEVLDSTNPVLVVFLVGWSQPCHVMKRVLESFSDEDLSNVKIFQSEADESLELSLSYNIQSIPTLLLFVKGREEARIIGTATKDAILHKIRPFISVS